MICRQPHAKNPLNVIVLNKVNIRFGSASSIFPVCCNRRHLHLISKSLSLASWRPTVQQIISADSDLAVYHSIQTEYMQVIEMSSGLASGSLHRFSQHHHWTKMLTKGVCTFINTWDLSKIGTSRLLRSESPSGMYAKLRTVAPSNDTVHPTRSLYYCLFAPHMVFRAHSVRGETFIQRKNYHITVWKWLYSRKNRRVYERCLSC